MREEKGLVGIRVDGGKGIGFGHIVRCVALADCISDFADVLFLTNTKNDLYEIIKGRYQICEVQSDKNGEIYSMGNLSVVIIDLLEGGEGLSERLIGKIDKIVLISDFPRYIPPVNMYIFPTFIPLDIEKPRGVEVFSGGNYILLRREILSYLYKGCQVGDIVENIVIVLGGGYRREEEEIVLSALQDVGFRGRVILYSGIYNYNRTANYDFKLDIYKGFKLPYKDIYSSDLVICGSGVSLFETMALRKPSITIPGSKREEMEVDILSKEGVCIDGRGDIKEKIRTVLERCDIRRSIVDKLDGVIDGKGAERVTRAIREMMVD
ncbi:MAG: hypothetical protein ACUVWP_07250 [bacterium]